MGEAAAALLLARVDDPGRPTELVEIEAPLLHRASGDILPP